MKANQLLQAGQLTQFYLYCFSNRNRSKYCYMKQTILLLISICVYDEILRKETFILETVENFNNTNASVVSVSHFT